MLLILVKYPKVIIAAALNAELDEQLGYFRHEQPHKDNYHNGYSSKAFSTEVGEIDMDTREIDVQL
ncbi:transposase [Thalassotalea atypica]|uniref:transposase n=1 Tax=Thalassotalea atypica TaxID=2054316 RepID=UPI00330643E4